MADEPRPDLLDLGCPAKFSSADGRRLRGTVCVVNFDAIEQDGATPPEFGFRERDGTVHPIDHCSGWVIQDRDTRPSAL